MKNIKNYVLVFIFLIGILCLIIIGFRFYKSSNEEVINIKPNYEVMYDMCKSKCSNYTTFNIANNKEVGMKVVLYQNKTIKEVECLCLNNNMSRSVKLW